MSQENVDLVMGFQPDPDMDLVERFSDDDSWAAFSAALAPAFAPGFESANALLGIEKTYIGMDGFQPSCRHRWRRPPSIVFDGT